MDRLTSIGAPIMRFFRFRSGSALNSSRVALLVLTCAGLLSLLGFGTTALARRASLGAPVLSAASDTVVLFGPKTFHAARSTAIYVEQFTETHDPTSYYLLEITNGAPDGTSRISDGTVKLNGVVVFAPTDLQTGGTVLTKEIWIADGTNTKSV